MGLKADKAQRVQLWMLENVIVTAECRILATGALLA